MRRCAVCGFGEDVHDTFLSTQSVKHAYDPSIPASEVKALVDELRVPRGDEACTGVNCAECERGRIATRIAALLEDK